MTCQTQAERLVKALRTRWMTYGELQDLHISQCPWKRLGEAAWRYLKPGEQIKRVPGADGLLRLRVVKG